MELKTSRPRFFNELKFSDDTVVKASVDIEKIRSEYTFSKIAPQELKQYLVEPHDFKIENNRASYSLARISSPDLSIPFTDGTLSLEDFQALLDLCFEYFKKRPTKSVPHADWQKVSDMLYAKKVKQRAAAFAKTSIASQVDSLVRAGTRFSSLDGVSDFYKMLFSKITTRRTGENVLAASHGDFCLSNMFIVDGKLKLIDPRGALSEAELFLDPYYDLAKLSHSILGMYDFFNTKQYSINLDDQLRFHLSFHNPPKPIFAKIFMAKLAENSYDYLLVRLYEASLFLSMLPLHIDDPHKTFAFVLNAINILEEVSYAI